MIHIKNEKEITGIRQACTVAAKVLDILCATAIPGISTYDIDKICKKIIKKLGAQSACLNYRIGKKVYPAYTCLSVNEEVIHGIGSVQRVLKDGDNIAIDVVVRYKGFVGDNARTIIIGKGNKEMINLLKVTEASLFAGIKRARKGNRIGDISYAIQSLVERNGFSVVREYVGHGIGRIMHEAPYVPNYGKKGIGPELYPGMTLAIEPIVNIGSPKINIGKDGWTVKTYDGYPSAHFEHTILITDNQAEILTKPLKGINKYKKNA